MAKKKSFLLFIDRKKEVDMLTNEQAGILFKAVMQYADSGKVPDCEDIAVRMLFSVLQSQIDENAKKYEEVCKSRSVGQKKRYEQLKQDVQKAQEVQKATDTDTVTATDTETTTVTDTVSLSTETEQNLTDRPTSTNTFQSSHERTLDFPVLLYNMRSPLYEEFQSEEELSHYDTEARYVDRCIIPDKFRYNIRNMENALKYLIAFSTIEKKEFKDFCSMVITAIAEAVHTGQISRNQQADPLRMISRLNEINSDQEYSLVEWVQDFRLHYDNKLKEKLASGQTISNRHAFLKSCAVNFLFESKALNFCPSIY